MPESTNELLVYLSGPVKPTEEKHRWRQEIHTLNSLPGLSFTHTEFTGKSAEPSQRVYSAASAINEADGVLVYYGDKDARRTAVEAFIAVRSEKPVEGYLGQYSGSEKDLDPFLQYSVNRFHRSARDALHALYQRL